MPEPPPSCFVVDLKCAYRDPGAWWRTNGKPLAVGAAVVGLGTCLYTAGVGCAIASGAASVLSMTDRTYDFVQNKEYNDGFWANAKYGGGMALDTLGFLPGLGLARGASSGTRGAGAVNSRGGYFTESSNAAGGRVFLSTGEIKQGDFASFVDDGVAAGEDVHIITGAHGYPNGNIGLGDEFYRADMRKFGRLPGVKLHYLPSMTENEIEQVMQGQGVIIGALCHSALCLEDFM